MIAREYRHHCQVTRLLSLQHVLVIALSCLSVGMIAGAYLHTVAGLMSALTHILQVH